jgi:hypothetical protein
MFFNIIHSYFLKDSGINAADVRKKFNEAIQKKEYIRIEQESINSILIWFHTDTFEKLASSDFWKDKKETGEYNNWIGCLARILECDDWWIDYSIIKLKFKKEPE